MPKPNRFERSYRDTAPPVKVGSPWHKSQKTPLSRAKGVWTVSCDFCGLSINKRVDQLRKYSGHFCSPSCLGKSRMKRVKIACLICTSIFDKKSSKKDVTCSKGCSLEYRRRRMIAEVKNMSNSAIFAYGIHERGENIGRHSGLVPEKVRQIRVDKRSQSVIATEYGINQSTVSKIKLRQRWAHVED